MTTAITHATSSDFPALHTLLAHSGLPQDGLIDHLATTLVAQQGNEVVGSAALEVYGNMALLRSVVVASTLRSRGLGTRLVDTALDLARQQQLTQVYLLTETATDFFLKHGFHIVSRGDVAPAVQQSVEFTHVCPESATAMVLRL